MSVYLAPRQTITNLDFWYHVVYGQQLDPGDTRTLIDGLYPLGYPFLLRAAIAQSIDVLRFGQILSALGGVCAIAALYWITYRATTSVVLAVLGSLLLLSNEHFIGHATVEGNDMLAAGLQAVALLLVWLVIADGDNCAANRNLVLAGLLVGLAYLTRYTALVIVPVLTFFIAWRYARKPRVMLVGIGLFLGIFLITTAIQWIPSLAVHGTPFYNSQAKNVWFGIYGQHDWVNNWNKVPDGISLLAVFSIDPVRFLLHWWEQIRRPFLSLRLWPFWLHLAWIVSIPVMLFDRSLLLFQRAYFPLLLFVTMGTTALAWLDTRFLLLSLWIQCVLIVLLLSRVTSGLAGRLSLPSIAVGAALYLSAIAMQGPAVLDFLQNPIPVRAQEVNRFLRLAGMTDVEQVASNDAYLHATDEPAHTRYAEPYLTNPNPNNIHDVFSGQGAEKWKYFVLNTETGTQAYARLSEEFASAKEELAPLLMTDHLSIYCILPCEFADTQAVDLVFDPGIHLLSYRLQNWDKAGSLYLYWRAERPILESYKVSVRVLDEAGDTVMQIDNIPQVWTSPTNEWTPGRTVVDYYGWELEKRCTDCQMQLLLYDVETMEPLPARTSDGTELGPLISLESPSR